MRCRRPFAPLRRPGRWRAGQVVAQAASASRTVAEFSSADRQRDAVGPVEGGGDLGGRQMVAGAGVERPAQQRPPQHLAFGCAALCDGERGGDGDQGFGDRAAGDRGQGRPLGLGVGAGVLIPGHRVGAVRLGAGLTASRYFAGDEWACRRVCGCGTSQPACWPPHHGDQRGADPPRGLAQRTVIAPAARGSSGHETDLARLLPAQSPSPPVAPTSALSPSPKPWPATDLAATGPAASRHRPGLARAVRRSGRRCPGPGRGRRRAARQLPQHLQRRSGATRNRHRGGRG
jgi:hypothetical protein